MKLINSNFVKMNGILVFSLFIALFFTGNFSIASSHEKAKKEVKEAALAIKDYTIEQKDEAVANAHELMEEFDDRMHIHEGRMKEKWGKLKDSSKDNYEVSKKSIEKQREELSLWLDKLQNSSSDAWDEIKTGFTGAYDVLQEEWKEVENDE